MTLTEFLLARIAEDEAAAVAAVTRSDDPARDGVNEWVAVGGGTVVGPAFDSLRHLSLPSREDATAQHIARHDPARVLAECEAKRRIVEIHRPHPFLLDDDRGEAWECEACGGDVPASGAVTCPTTRALATVYADHPDCDETWRP